MSVCHCFDNTPINDPNQLPLEFGYNPQSVSYDEGYEAGKHWDANWIPGGPWIYTCYDFSKADEMKKEADSRRAYDDWHGGFAQGFKERLVDNPEFAEWLIKQRGSGHKRFREVIIDDSVESK